RCTVSLTLQWNRVTAATPAGEPSGSGRSQGREGAVMRIAAGKRFAAAGGVLAGLLLVGIATAGSAPQSWGRLADASSDPLKAMATVDCLLPGQVRRSGRINYIGPALPVKTTAELCEKRGGEYVAYDRASLQST